MRRKALIIGLDGARGDLIAKGARNGIAPHIAGFVFQTPRDCARPHSGPKTHPEAYWKTCPGWSSVLSGLDNNKHHVWDNTEASIVQFWATRLRYGSLFDHAQNLRTLACGRPNVIGFSPNIGILDPIKFTKVQSRPVSDPKGDYKNTDFALKNMHEVDIMFVHLDMLDQAGHKYGWGSRQYMQALEKIDVLIGRLVDACRQDKHDWLILVTADHGGHGYNHNTVEGKDNCIPFYSNKKLVGQKFSHLDITPTVLRWMGKRVPKYMDGIPRNVRRTNKRG